MLTPHACALLFLVAAALVWCGLAVQVFRVQRHLRTLEPLTGVERSPTPGPPVTVVIPARNEAEGIEATVRSLLYQQGVDLDLVVVNDGSTDATGQILDRLAAADGRLRVLHDPALPPGWLGKTNAMQQGAALATGELILFTDADIVYAPGALAAAIAYMERAGLEFLTLAPTYRWESVLENSLVAAFFAVMLTFGSTRYEDPEAPDAAVGVGAFMMIRARVYQAIGGHAPVRASIVDDGDFGVQVKRAGHRIGVLLAPRCIEVRMYRGNRATVFAFSKNLFAALGGRLWIALPVGLLATWLLAAGPAVAAIGLARADSPLAAGGLALYLLQYGCLLGMRSWQRFRSVKLLAFPLFLLVLWASLARALYYHLVRGSVVWRGREVKLG